MTSLGSGSTTEGSSPWDAISRRNLVFGGSIRSDRDHDADIRIGGEAPGRQAQSTGRHRVHGSRRVTAASDRHRRFVVEADERRNPLFLLLLARAGHSAGRRTTPSGTSPAVTNRHSAMRSLRASATIIVLRLLPAVTRASNHCARALCFW